MPSSAAQVLVGLGAHVAHVLEHVAARRRCPRAPARSSRATPCGRARPCRDRLRARRRASCSSVVLPAPLRPSTSIRSPRPTSKLTSSNTVLGPNAFARSSTSSVDEARRAAARAASRGPCDRRARRSTRFAAELLDAMVDRLGDARPLLGLAAHRVGERLEARDLAGLAGRELRSGARRRPSAATRYCEYVPRYSMSSPSSMCSTRVIDLSRSSRSWLITSSAPRYDRRNCMSHCLASMSRWFVGSSSRSRSLPAKRIRVSSTRRRSPPESAVIGRSRRSRREAEPGGDAPHLGVGRVPAGVAERVLGVAVGAARCAATRRPPSSGAARRAGGSRRRGRAPTSTCASAVPSTPVPRGDGSCER